MIEFSNVSKRYGPQTILDGVSFRIHAGERLGIVGSNGAGKSTIFNLIVGDGTPDQGAIHVARHAELGYMRQELEAVEAGLTLLESVARPTGSLQRIHDELHALHGDLDGAQADSALLDRMGDLQTRFEHLDGYNLSARAEATLSGLGFREAEFGLPLKTFSGGWRLRAELARLLTANPDALLLDEPSNYLDLPAIEWLQRYLSDFPGTLIMISHDRYLLNTLTRATLEVAHGRVERYAGNYNAYVLEKRTRAETRLASQKNLDRKRQHLEAFINRFRAQATKAAQVQSRIKELARLEDLDAIPAPTVGPAKIRLPVPPRSGLDVVRLEKAGLSYDGTRWVFRHLDVRVERGQKIALVGLNGMGKTTLLRALTGAMPLSEGKRVLGHKVVTGYQSQDFAESLDPALSVFENARAVSSSLTEGETRSLLGGFGFSGDKAFQAVASLSGGEKIRAAFARLMMQPTNFLVLDEPTTHLDIAARETLEDALRRYEGTVCLVSHDADFVRNVANHVWAVTAQGLQPYWGGYDYYLEKSRGQAPAAQPAAKSSAAPDRKAQRRERAEQVQSRGRQRRVLRKTMDKAESESERLEKEQADLLERLQAGTVDDYVATNRRLMAIQEALEAASARWEQAAGELEILDG